MEIELSIVALVLLAWQTVRIPLEGDVATAVAHAHDVLALERALSLDLESAVIDWAAATSAGDWLEWLYTNMHLPMLFAFMAAIWHLAPEQYARVRTIFVVSFVPAVVIIGAYPLAPPRWLPELGLGPAPTDDELVSTSGGLFHNETAAAASQHFGFAVLVAGASIWLFRRSWLAWATLAYPALVFVVIVGTGNHYLLDCVIGTLTFVLAAAFAHVLHGDERHASQRARPREALLAGLGYGLVVWGFVSLHVTDPANPSNLWSALVMGAGASAVLAPRWGAIEATEQA